MKKIFLSIIVLLLIFSGCSQLRLSGKYIMVKIKVGEEEKYTFKKITNDFDYINATIKNKKMTFYDLLDRVYDISNDGQKFIFQAMIGKQPRNSLDRLGNYIYERKICDKEDFRIVSKYISWDGVYSNDGEKIAYIHTDSGLPKIWLVNLKEKDLKSINITNGKSYPINPIFAPGDTLIFYAYLEDTKNEYLSSDDNKKTNKCFFIYKLNLRTKIETKICSGYNVTFFPNDRNQIVFCRKNYKWAELWYRNLKTGEERLILKDDSTGLVQPSVSPDGEKIAYTARTINPVYGNNFDIYVVNINGKNKRQITFHPGNDYCPEWSNDGNSLYFVSQRGNIEAYHCIWNVSFVKYYEL
ncbi:MAG TPA: hypothetical protein PKD67_01915 [Ignavibacteriaceae bacterium]|nr:hypothetical protein [Ignavibacteriaceae bacterium]